MPRIAEGRTPAAPHSDDQKDRYRRILRAAAELGDEHPLERVQMTDVAKRAGVAIATLYRYFPSKNDLFVALLNAQIDRFSHDGAQRSVGNQPPPPANRSGAVAEALIQAGRRLLARPTLSTSLMQANNASQLMHKSDHTGTNARFHRILLDALGIEEPTEDDLRMLRIVEQTWYGIVVSTLNNVIDVDQADDDIRLAMQLLLGPRYDIEDSP